VHGQQITTFILIRHAEKLAEGGNDPFLSPEGNARAKRLQALLEKTELDAIYTTPYKRTRGTVEPVAHAKGLIIREYEPQKPTAIEEMLHTHAGKTILVSGHSNTIPEIANWLTGSEKFTTFNEDDYGNVMVVCVLTKGQAVVTWLRY
jgi:broad specificity phosphatase PhoE